MCCPTPGAPGYSCPTRPYTSFFGMKNRWWPYSACFLGTYGRYPAGGCHPPWCFLIGPNDLYLADVVAPLPSHCLGTDTFVNGSLHISFSAMWPSLVPGSRTLSKSMYLSRAASGESGFLKCLQLSSSTPQNTCARQSAHTFPLAHSCLVTQIVRRTRPVCVAPSFQNISSGKRNNSTAHDVRCCITLEVGVVFL